MPARAIEILQLKIQLLETRPPIWRRVLVQEDATLADLHAIIQTAFDWDDSHLHEFDADGKRYGIDNPAVDDWADPEVLDESDVKISRLFRTLKSSIRYTYDFGDDWQHKITLEKRLPRDPSLAYPRCTGGKRAGPPEDCGGPWGYLQLPGILKDPNHPEHEEKAAWISEDFDPEFFSLDDTNAALLALSRDRRR